MDPDSDSRSSTSPPSGDWAYEEECCAILHTADCVICDPWREHYFSSQGAPSLTAACMEFEERFTEHMISELDSIEDERKRADEESDKLCSELESVQKEIKEVEQDLVRLKNTTHQLQQEFANNIEIARSRLCRRAQDVHPSKYRHISPTSMDPFIPHGRAVLQSAEQQARDPDGNRVISPPSTSTASRLQANVGGTSSGVVFK